MRFGGGWFRARLRAPWLAEEASAELFDRYPVSSREGLGVEVESHADGGVAEADPGGLQ